MNDKESTWIIRILLLAILAMWFGIYLVYNQAHAGELPDPSLTPGAVRSTDAKLVCATRTGDVRLVTTTDKIAVRKAYNYQGGPHEIDHLIPLAIGGSNDRSNLWPQEGLGPNNFHDKDRCELAVYKAVCAGRIDIKAAQAGMATNWIAFCKGVK